MQGIGPLDFQGFRSRSLALLSWLFLPVAVDMNINKEQDDFHE